MRCEVILGLILLPLSALAQEADEYDQSGIPRDLSSRSSIATTSEPGQPLVVSGTVYAPDGEEPVAGVTVYAYQTDVTGLYRRPGAGGPPRLRAWVKTDGQGRFELRTIRPGPYPNGTIPAHIHFRLFGAGFPRQWVDELRFDDDPLVTPAMKAASARGGRFGNVRPIVLDPDGVWRSDVSIRLRAHSNF